MNHEHLAEVFKRIEEKLDACLNASDQSFLLMDVGNINGSLQTLCDLELVDDYSVIQGYLDQVKHIIGLLEMQVIEVR